jgi:hypothetical protein
MNLSGNVNCWRAFSCMGEVRNELKRKCELFEGIFLYGEVRYELKRKCELFEGIFLYGRGSL